MSSLVSIIIPSYNNARYIVQAVESALAQTHPAVEVIVVDDGSTDATQQILAPYRSRIACLHQTNRGPAAARNAGLRIARGAYLLFLDSDDLLVPTSVAAKVSFLEQHPQYGLVYSAWKQINDDGSRVLGEVRPACQGDVLAALLRREFFFFPRLGPDPARLPRSGRRLRRNRLRDRRCRPLDPPSSRRLCLRLH